MPQEKKKTSDKICLVILAAGQGTRMKIGIPKPLAPIMNRAILDFVLDTCLDFKHQKSHDALISLVVGHQSELITTHIGQEYPDEKFHITRQMQQLGTADAVKSFLDQCPDAMSYKYTFILSGDVPMVSLAHLEGILEEISTRHLKAVVATVTTDEPTGYGRIQTHDSGLSIVEEKDANAEVKKIKKINTGLYVFETQYLMDCIGKISNNNKAREFYLTDAFQSGREVGAVNFERGEDLLGINTLEQLEETTKRLNRRNLIKLSREGVRFWDFASTFIESSVTIAPGVVIYPNVIIEGNSKIGAGCIIGPYCHIRNSELEEGVQIKSHSVLDGCRVANKAEVGPFARLRPEATIGNKAKVGNFVEIKKSTIGPGAKISHLSYVGDAIIGDNTNIGCGFITCNYDGIQKHVTKIGKNCFIGSDSQTIAPVEIGDNCFVASGSTINASMPAGSFGISRGRQTTHLNMAQRFLKVKKDI
ncbi:MAG: bifunctional UDP-N-acetylglucosamine diphosphorylase/glucosamine-1-phosphate N-acetyltransferase GlmU [Bdellovibrio sp.]|nr:bifunctional UDP-N-acetylglucosamine diphosphorylase/glucosamine-1-phosphate N-acetyltransferase GlmU [Bdellovibrio sp.]